MKLLKRASRIVGLAGLAALVAIGSVFAYWSTESTIENPFDTGKYGSTVREDFKPSEAVKWDPGVNVNKDVWVKNTGDTDIIVRVKLDEKWVRTGEPTPYKEINGETDGNVYTTGQVNPTDGETAADTKSVVAKNFVTANIYSDINTTGMWVDGGDGWYYYKSNLTGGSETVQWLDSVTLLSDADMGKFETIKYVSAITTPSDDIGASTGWFVYTDPMPKYIDALGAPCAATAPGAQEVLHNKTETTYAQDGGVDLMGYSKSDYTLTVTVQTVQPTQAALNEVFNGGATFTHPANVSWTLG